MSWCDLNVAFAKSMPVFHPGDIIEGHVVVEVHRDFEGTVYFDYQWRTHGRGKTDAGGRHQTTISGQMQFQAGNIYKVPFQFKAPSSPVSYRGHYFNVAWAINPRKEVAFILASEQAAAGSKASPSKPANDSKWPKKAYQTQPRKALTKLYAPTRGSGRILLGSVAVLTLSGIVGIVTLSRFWLLMALLGMVLGIYIVIKIMIHLKFENLRIRFTPYPHLGDQLDCHISFDAERSFYLRHISVELSMVETVTSGHGTDSTTYSKHFFKDGYLQEFERVVQRGEYIDVHIPLQIPADGGASFTATNNQLEWVVNIEIVPKQWPDFIKKREVWVNP